MTLTDIKGFFISVQPKKGESSTQSRIISLNSILKAYTELEILPSVPLPSEPQPPNITALLPNQDGQAGKFLTTDSENLSWAYAVPSQEEQGGKFLSTDGTSLTWVMNPGVPDQTNNSGKFLTTNGSAPSWADLTGLPSQAGSASFYLKTDGTTASWTTMVLNTWANDAARPLNPAVGTIGVNLTSNKVECFINETWTELH